MSLKDQLTADMKEAMRQKDKVALSTIRLLKASVQNEEIALGQPLNEEQELTVLSRELKQRRDSLAEFEKAGRDDLTGQLNEEIAVVKRYMPEQLSDEEIRSIVEATIEKVGATQMSDFGKVMGAVMPQVKGKADGNKVNAVVKQLLQEK